MINDDDIALLLTWMRGASPICHWSLSTSADVTVTAAVTVTAVTATVTYVAVACHWLSGEAKRLLR